MNNISDNAHYNRILIVDDTAANLRLLTDILTKQDYTVYPASDGELALEFVRANLPDLILLDIRMPGMDGYEVCRRLKADERTRSIPVIFISILEDELDKTKAFQEGALDYITKPFRPEEVLARVKTHLHLRELTVRLEHKVNQRTEALAQANRELLDEIAERKKAEDALRASEERFHHILDAMLDGCQIIDFDWRYVYLNDTVVLHGHSSKEAMIGHTMMEMYPGIENTDMFRTLHKCMESRIPGRLENKFIYPDGNIGWFDLSILPVKEGIFILSKDITERKQAEREHLENLRFFENMDKVNCAIQGADDIEKMMHDLLDIVLSIFDCDRAYLMYPCDPESPTWTIPMERTKPEYPGVLDLKIELPMDPQTSEIQRVLLTADGPATFDMHTSPPLPEEVSKQFDVKTLLAMAIYPKTGSPWQFGIQQCSHVREWTDEEKKLLAAIGNRLQDPLTSLLMYRDLQESEERYRRLADNATDVIWTMDMDRRFTYVSPSVHLLRGYSADEAMEQSVDQVLTPESLEIALDSFHQECELLKQNGVTRAVMLELEQYCKDGTTIWTQSQMSFLTDSGGEPIGLLGITRDITERKTAEEALVKLKNELELRVQERTAELQARSNELNEIHIALLNIVEDLNEKTEALEVVNKELEAFSYSVSHDLRAPLRAIDGFSQILLEEYRDKVDEQGKEYLQRIRTAAQRMAQLIDDMLSLSRISRGEMNIQELNLSEIVQEICNNLSTAQPERKVEFIVKDGMKARGDSRLLHIVLENLIGNAWKFSSKKDEARIEFGIQEQKGGPVYCIRDNGAGFDMKYAQKLFGAFQRLHTNTEFPGTGIGLATVQRIIHRHGGRIWAEGEVEKGAAFYFTL